MLTGGAYEKKALRSRKVGVKHPAHGKSVDGGEQRETVFLVSTITTAQSLKNSAELEGN